MEKNSSENPKPFKILLIDDDEDDFILTRDILADIEHFDFELEWEMHYRNAFDRISQKVHDIYLIDYRLGENDGISLISKAVKHNIFLPMIILTGKGDHKIDLKAMNEGAADYMIKGEMTPQMMERSIRYALNNSKALQMVREGESKYRQLFERSIDAIYIADNNHNFIDINPSLSSQFEYSRDELLGKNMSSLFEVTTHFTEFKKLIEKENQVKEYQATLITKGGKQKICQLTSVIRKNHENEPIGFQGIIHDITLRKKAQQELLVAERLSMTGKLARSIAHEVRNPLSNVGLALDQLEDEITSKNEDIVLFLDIIKRNSDRIDQLITEMLNSSKPRALNKAPYSINKVVTEAYELVRDRLTLKGMQFQKNLEQSIPPVSLDKDILKVAISNILVNAIEAMKENQGILKVNTIKNDEQVIITISDNGLGIAQQELGNLFDPFFTKKQGGMGLGLTSTQSIIHSHGGSINVNSVLGDGTSFSIYLPLTTA